VTGTLDDEYLAWLYLQVGGKSVKDPTRPHWTLLRQLYSTEFVWLIPNDDNRAADGKALRDEFLTQKIIFNADPSWYNLGCSFLEMLISLARMMSFQAEGSSRAWFWHFIKTLGLLACTDATPCREEYVTRVVETVIWRTYEPNGHGGLFPLRHAEHDQRKVEIWYQMCEWLLQT
jgi:hypothetical protein